MATTAVNIACEGCTCNISYYNNNGVLQTGYCSNNSSVTVYANKAYSATLSQISTASGYTTPITFYYNRSNGSGYDGSETLSGSTRTISDLSFGRTLKLVATGATVTAHLKCGNGISSYRVYDSSGSSIAQITGTNSYTTLTLTKGAYYGLGGIVYEDGWSGIKWWYNSSSSYSYPNTSTTNPDYQLGSNYDRWGYFEATDYTDPTVYHSCIARAGTGVQSATVNGSSTASVKEGTTAAFRCSLKANYTWDGWYYSDTLQRYSYTKDLDVSVYEDLDLTAKATYNPPSYQVRAIAGTGVSWARVNGSSSAYVDEGDAATFTCSLLDGYSWVGWYENGQLAYSSRSPSLTIQSARTLTAVAEPITYTCYAYKGTGISTATVDNKSSTTASYGDTVTYRASVSYGYTWDGWYDNYGNLLSRERPYTHTVTENAYVTARATKNQYTVSAAAGAGVSSATVNGGTSASIGYGDTAQFRCTLQDDYTWVGWYEDGELAYSTKDLNLTIYSARTLTATAARTQHTAYAYSTGFGCCFSSVSVSPSSFTSGTTVTFTATLNPGYTFRGWYDSNGNRVSTSRTYTVTGGSSNITYYARADFAWTYDKQSGSSTISAEEFRRLQTYITQRNGASFSSQPNVGDAMTRNYYNLLRDAIGTGSTVVKFQVISAALLNMLRDNANGL